MKRLVFIVCLLVLAYFFSIDTLVAAEGGPAELILHSTLDPAPKAKPAFFPHATHQKQFECGTCHHTQGQNSKKMGYSNGMAIYRCESCHNKGGEGISQDYNTFKKVAHELCRGCHTERIKEGKPAGPTNNCTGCHRKDLE